MKSHQYANSYWSTITTHLVQVIVHKVVKTQTGYYKVPLRFMLHTLGKKGILWSFVSDNKTVISKNKLHCCQASCCSSLTDKIKLTPLQLFASKFHST